MLLLSIIMIPGVLLVCIGLIFSIGMMDASPQAAGQDDNLPDSQVETIPPAELVRLD